MVLSRFVRPVLTDPLKKDWVSGEAIFFGVLKMDKFAKAKELAYIISIKGKTPARVRAWRDAMLLALEKSNAR
jgi:hypothetical protein